MKKSLTYIVGGAFLFGTMEVALKLAGSSFGAMQLTCLRFLIGGLCLLPFALRDRRKREPLTRGDWLYLLLLGVLCICVSMVLFQMGVMRTNANLAAVVISTSPVFTMIFARFIAEEKLTKRKLLGLALSLAGLAAVANPALLLRGEAEADGILMTLTAAAVFGLYTALGKKRIAKIGGLTQSSFSFILGSLALMAVLLITGQPVFEGIRASSLPMLLYAGVLVTGVGYFFYIGAIELAGPSMASMTFFLKAVIAPVLARLVLKEALTLNVILGVAFVLSGSLVNFIGAGAALPASEPAVREEK